MPRADRAVRPIFGIARTLLAEIASRIRTVERKQALLPRDHSAMREREIFDAALALTDPAQRSAYLAEVCASDDRLRQHLEGLLAMHQQLGSFLEVPAPALVATVDERPLTEAAGTLIGTYR